MSGIATDLLPLAFAISELDPLPGNPRRGDIDAVAKSLARFGQRKPVTARLKPDGRGEVTAGNHTMLAARDRLGWPQLAVVWENDDDLTAKAWALADNRTAELASYDSADLLAMMQEVAVSPDDLAAASYTTDDLARVMALLKKENPEAPEVFPEVDPGDLKIEHVCPACGYEWSGNPKPSA